MSKKVCKHCQGLTKVALWQFPVNENGYVPAKSDGKGGYVNGRLLSVSCNKCVGMVSAEILKTGSNWLDTSTSDEVNPMNLKQVVLPPKV